ncbi:TonB-dependent receptor plug domain-containing protein [Muricauda sp. JGD-17]|uniref:TonB-dependent receptor plug domain-containing protein n=1 Tax=Flagellimonas ochracea TaxID=2696472 RepID=A0A964TAD9_9FLAO|nr:TonB-dependent receptor [Allomuricauda ochracea]NAY90546.1 TonB-dependent receptor plug domain-containing protein [Allomuricauda ochracea]
MKNLVLFISLLFFSSVQAQTVISGRVTDTKKNPIAGANVYLEGTYDGASTDENGNFNFETVETGTQTLVVSILSYEPHYEVGDVKYFNELTISLIESINSLTGVTLTAGTFEAGDNSKVSVLKPLDIVTTAGAVGDFVGALQTLPGTATVNEDGRLFVRGGDAGETQVFIDGLRVFQPFNATANNIPTRGRFSAFLFKGITFSTGGYSAEYGQALSSVLLLNTTDVPTQEKTDVSIMSVGAGLGHTEIWGDQSVSLNTSYINLAPYEGLIPSTQGVRWNSPYESISGEAVFRSKGERSMFKLYTGFNHANLDIEQEDINFEDFVSFQLTNDNLYFNSSYKYFFENDWSITTGASVAWDTNDIVLLEDNIETKERAMHTKLKAHKSFSSKLNIDLGTELFIVDYEDTLTEQEGVLLGSGYNNQLWAGFVETNIFFSNQLAMKVGARAEHSSLLTDFTLSPRVSLAYKPGEKGQFSLAYGDFYQNPRNEVIKFDDTLLSERTSHYILNYQYLEDGKTLRAEAYYKDYRNLIKHDTQQPQFNSVFSNNGFGHAAGLDIFWRDNKSVKNLDYWLSYSFLDTERDFRDFREAVRPNFAPKHNLSLVTKYWVDDLRSQVGFSYAFASGRPYDNANTAEFMAERTKSFNSLSFNWAYLIDQQKILYFSVNNVLGFNNINNYQYANTPNGNGTFDRRAIRPAADSFFFVGFFWTISSDGKSNQLDNL